MDDTISKHFYENHLLKLWDTKYYEAFTTHKVKNNSSYSAEYKSAESYFERFQLEINSLEDLFKAVTSISNTMPDSQFLWRGQGNSEWGVHSLLFRKLMQENNVKPPGTNSSEKQNFPTEIQMQQAEKKLINFVRREWRYSNLGAMEILATLQHHGAPTRLLDVSRNLLIATWFALEKNPETKSSDARIIGFSSRPAENSQQPFNSHKIFEVDSVNPHYKFPFWHQWKDVNEMTSNNWGTGAQRRIWIPPTYDPRIPAQNAAFILDGVPIITQDTASYFRKESNSNKYWKKSDLLASSSIYIRLEDPRKNPRPIKPKFSPTYSLKIKASAKDEIRSNLEKIFSYTKSSIYPDISGAAQYINKDFSEIINE